MNAANLTETASVLIRNHIQSNIQQALLDVSTEYGDGKVSLPNPKDYFFNEKKNLVSLPVVAIMANTLDFALDRGPNHPNALLDMTVSIVCENRNEDLLTVQCWRYEAALYKILHGAQLTNVGGDLKIIVKVMRANYSPIYISEDENTTKGVFRKEMTHELEVNVFENLSN